MDETRFCLLILMKHHQYLNILEKWAKENDLHENILLVTSSIGNSNDQLMYEYSTIHATYHTGNGYGVR